MFGSYAYGTPDEDSDIDLLVVLSFSGSHIAKAVEIVRAVNPPFSVDLIVWRPEELALRLVQGDFFLREIVAKGKVLYDAAYAGVG